MVFADLDNLRASELPPTTIPYDVVVTTARPDIVVLSRDGKIRIAELTICTNSPEGLKNAKKDFQEKLPSAPRGHREERD